MSFEQKISRHFSRHGPFHSQDHTFGKDGSGFALPNHQLVVLILGLLNVVLLLAAVVLGIYCAKAKDFEVLDSATTPLIVELNYLRNRTDVNRAKQEAEAALAKERTNHLHLKIQVKERIAFNDILQRNIDTLQKEKTFLQSNKTVLEENCGHCLAGWILLKSTCYYYSRHGPDSRRNWNDSRADCIHQGGDLLVINNLVEQQLLSDNFPTLSSSGSTWWQNGFWIGLTDVVTEGTWLWINNVTEVNAMYWRNGQPNQSGPQSGNCAAFLPFSGLMTLYNANCQEHQLNWICEMEPRQT